MAFPPAVKSDALAASGRHCCICHKFCGTKIECHHIVQESEGGGDTLDNCIPVCFDCHADMRSYDFMHPKGTKYSSQELKRHRDGWYQKVERGGALSADSDHLAVDRHVFERLREQVPYEPTFEYLKGRNFAGWSFELEPLRPLDRYAHDADRPDNEFLDPELEGARGAVVAAIKAFNIAIGRHTFSAGQPGWNKVPEEWEETQPERFEQAVTEIHESANALEKAYAELIRLARRRLAVA